MKGYTTKFGNGRPNPYHRTSIAFKRVKTSDVVVEEEKQQEVIKQEVIKQEVIKQEVKEEQVAQEEVKQENTEQEIEQKMRDLEDEIHVQEKISVLIQQLIDEGREWAKRFTESEASTSSGVQNLAMEPSINEVQNLAMEPSINVNNYCVNEVQNLAMEPSINVNNDCVNELVELCTHYANGDRDYTSSNKSGCEGRGVVYASEEEEFTFNDEAEEFTFNDEEEVTFNDEEEEVTFNDDTDEEEVETDEEEIYTAEEEVETDEEEVETDEEEFETDEEEVETDEEECETDEEEVEDVSVNESEGAEFAHFCSTITNNTLYESAEEYDESERVVSYSSY